ncbi:hypothetical protein C8R44DRAFT_747280 [Mycena epipterygia]|nr:hypothetical protein C8R44DRAFT_747280 [Mycena epipterygia]
MGHERIKEGDATVRDMEQEGIRAAKERRNSMRRSSDATWEMGEGRKGQRRWAVVDVEGMWREMTGDTDDARRTQRGHKGRGQIQRGWRQRRPTRWGADASESPVSRSPPPRASCPGTDRSHVGGGQVRGKGSARKNGGWHIRTEGEDTEEEHAEQQGASGEEEEDVAVGQGGDICVARSRRARYRGEEEEEERGAAIKSAHGRGGECQQAGERE